MMEITICGMETPLDDVAMIIRRVQHISKTCYVLHRKNLNTI